MPEEIFELAVRVCSWVIAAGCFLGGLGLLIAPKAVAKLNRVLNRSFPVDRLQKILEKPIEIDQWIVGNRVIVGIVALVVSVLLFFLLVTG